MPTWTIPLTSGLSASLAGRKASALGRLIEAGFPVPASLCITTDAYHAALRASPGHPRLPDGLLDELAAALPMDAALAVRSSAVLEDLPEASFAGRTITRLNVTGRAALEEAVLDCWRSNDGTPDWEGGGGMAVLIQPLLEAECAGVCFSVDPVRLRPDLLLIVSAWGLGAGVVAGSVPSDTARLRRVDLEIQDFTTAYKHSGLYAAQSGGGVTPAAIPEDLRAIPCLPESWLKRVGQFGLAAEQVFGTPQDVEWAIAGGQLWILQSRPITALPAETLEAARFRIAWSDDEARHFWWLWAAHDSAGSPLLPAEDDFKRTSTRGGLDAVYLGGSADTRLFKYVNGRGYMAAAKSPNSAGHVRVYGAARRDLYERLAQQDITWWEYWGPEIVGATGRLAAFEPRRADGPGLAEHLEDAIAAATRHWMIHTIVPGRPIRSAALLELYARLTDRPSSEIAADIPFLLAGSETIQTRLVEALYDLACLALESPEAAKAAVLDNSAGGGVDAPNLAPVAQGTMGFVEAFQRLIAEYGDRLCSLPVPGFPVEMPLPWREAPEQVWEMVAAYLPLARQGGPTPRETRLETLRSADQRIESLCTAAIASGTDPTLVKEFRSKLAYARRNAVYLDEHNHYIDLISYGQYVQSLIYAGRWLAAHGCLPGPFDVFWLNTDEVLAGMRNPESGLEAVIATRRSQFGEQQAQIAPACLGLPDFKLPERTAQPPRMAPPVRHEDQPANQLTGEPASRGRAAGRARLIISDAPPGDILPGDVLVARSAGPVMIPLLPAAAALVLDKGGPGDHFAITAREFGLPCVCATGFATLRISEGAWVTVDADSGLVSWIGEMPDQNH